MLYGSTICVAVCRQAHSVLSFKPVPKFQDIIIRVQTFVKLEKCVHKSVNGRCAHIREHSDQVGSLNPPSHRVLHDRAVAVEEAKKGTAMTGRLLVRACSSRLPPTPTTGSRNSPRARPFGLFASIARSARSATMCDEQVFKCVLFWRSDLEPSRAWKSVMRPS